MNRFRNVVLSLFTLTVLAAAFNNCSPVHNLDGAETGASTKSIDITSADALKAQQILSLNCTGCHGSSSGSGGVSNITDLQGLADHGLIVPGDSANSPLYQAVHSGAMPPSNPLAATDVLALKTWIDEALAGGGTPAPQPTPSPTPGGTDMTTFTYISQQILTPKCVACHGPSMQGGGFRFDTYANAMMAVQAHNLSGSLMYTQVASAAMPQNGPVLSTSNIEAIAGWIQNGAPNN